MDLGNALQKFKAAGKKEEWFQCIQAIYADDKDAAEGHLLEFRREMKKEPL